MFQHDGLMAGMCTFAHRTHTVERGYTKSGSKVAVGCSAGRGLIEREAEFGRKSAGLREQPDRFRASAPSEAD